MSHLVNPKKYNFTEEDIKDLIGRLDPNNAFDKLLIKKLLTFGRDIK